MKKQLWYTLIKLMIGIVGLLIVPTMICGWVWNIIKIVGGNFDPITGMRVARCIGVFVAPLGAVLGFL